MDTRKYGLTKLCFELLFEEFFGLTQANFKATQPMYLLYCTFEKLWETGLWSQAKSFEPWNSSSSKKEMSFYTDMTPQIKLGCALDTKVLSFQVRYLFLHHPPLKPASPLQLLNILQTIHFLDQYDVENSLELTISL